MYGANIYIETNIGYFRKTAIDLADDKKQDTQTNTIRELNLKIQKDDRINYSLLPLSDGLSFIQKK